MVRAAFEKWALAGNRTRRVRTTPRWVARGMGELAVGRWGLWGCCAFEPPRYLAHLLHFFNRV